MRSALVDLDREFALKATRLREERRLPRQQRVTTLAPGQLRDLAKVWVTAVFETDERARRNGLDETEFEDLGERIAAQRSELGPMLARDHIRPILPAMYSFLRLCGIDARVSAADEQQVGYAFLEAVVTALDHQAQRQRGSAVSTAALTGDAQPLHTWEQVFVVWRDYVVERPKAKTIANRTAWRQLEAFARRRDILWPSHVTSQLMTKLVDDMRANAPSPMTINERFNKIRAQKGTKHVLREDRLGCKQCREYPVPEP